MSNPTTLRLCAAAIDAGLNKDYGPTHPQAGKFTPEFLASVGKHLSASARRIEELERALGVCASTMGDLRRAALEMGEHADAVMFAAAERACNAALATTKEGA